MIMFFYDFGERTRKRHRKALGFPLFLECASRCCGNLIPLKEINTFDDRGKCLGNPYTPCRSWSILKRFGWNGAKKAWESNRNPTISWRGCGKCRKPIKPLQKVWLLTNTNRRNAIFLSSSMAPCTSAATKLIKGKIPFQEHFFLVPRWEPMW